MFWRFLFVGLFCLMIDGAVPEPRKLPVPGVDKYDNALLNAIDPWLERNVPKHGYEIIVKVLSVLTQPEDAINDARQMVIGDSNSQAAQVANFAIDKILLLTLVVGTGFGIIIKLMLWVLSG